MRHKKIMKPFPKILNCILEKWHLNIYRKNIKDINDLQFDIIISLFLKTIEYFWKDKDGE